MSDTPEKIEAWFRDQYAILQDVYGKYGVKPEDEAELSKQYKARHTAIIESRKKEEREHERMSKFDETHSIRTCRVCDAELPPPSGRGRPAVTCERHR